MKISTENYEFAHGKKPRGTGMWAFDFRRNGAWTTEFAPLSWTYSQAASWARLEGRRMGADYIQAAS
jgi:hypothetical protein